MKAIVADKFGLPDVLALKEVAKPSPKDDEVLIKVMATGLNFADGALLTGKPLMIRLVSGPFKPKNPILGADVAGVVEAVGRDVTEFAAGDAVFGDLSGAGFGGLAEYVCAPADVLVRKPANVSFEQAAAVPMAAVTALQGLRDKGQIEAGQQVLIHGASGGVGTFAVQIAKALGAEVTAVCSTGKMEMVRSIGADQVVDYTREDFSGNGQRYDLIIGANGDRSLADYQRALTPEGTYVCTGGSMRQIFGSMLLGPVRARGSRQTLTNLMAQPDREDLAFVAELLENGRVVPVIDSCYPLGETAEAFRYLVEGHAKGKIVVVIGKA